MCHFETSKSNARGREKEGSGGKQISSFLQSWVSSLDIKKVALKYCDKLLAVKLSEWQRPVQMSLFVAASYHDGSLPLSFNGQVTPCYMRVCVHVRARVSPRPLPRARALARPISGMFRGSSHTARSNISIPSLKLISLNEVSEWLIIMMNVLLQ